MLNHCPPDASPDKAADEVVNSLAGAKGLLTGSGNLHIIAKRHGHPELLLHRVCDREVDNRLAKVGRSQQDARGRIHLPCRTDADTRDLL